MEASAYRIPRDTGAWGLLDHKLTAAGFSRLADRKEVYLTAAIALSAASWSTSTGCISFGPTSDVPRYEMLFGN